TTLFRSQRLIRRQAVLPLRRPVPVDDSAPVVHREDRVVDLGDDGLLEAQSLLGASLLGDVLEDGQDLLPAPVEEGGPDDLDVEDGPVLPAEPATGSGRGRPAVRLAVQGGEIVEQGGALLLGVEVVQRPPEELLSRVSVQSDGRLVDAEDGQRAPIEDPHRLGEAVEEKAGRVPSDGHRSPPAATAKAPGGLLDVVVQAQPPRLDGTSRIAGKPSGRAGTTPQLEERMSVKQMQVSI